MPGTDHQNPLDRGRRVRLLPGAACRRRQGAGGGAGLRGAWRRRRHPRRSPRSSPATASSRRRPTCSGGRCRGRSATTTSAARSASQPRLEKIKNGERDMVDTLALSAARCRSSTAAPRRWASATAGLTRSSGRSGSAMPPASRCHGVADAGLHRRARRRHRAGLHHLGRPGSSRAAAGAGRLPPGAGAHEERRGAHLPRHPAWLHDARRSRRPTTPKTRDFSMKRALAILDGLRGGGAHDAQGVVASTGRDSDLDIIVRPPHDARRGRPAAARPGPLRRRSRYSRRAACRVPAQPRRAWHG